MRFDGSGDVQEQIRLVDNAVSQGFDVIVVSLADPDAMEDSIRGAVAAGITVFSINSGEERGREFGAVTHFGQPDGVAGVSAGTAIKIQTVLQSDASTDGVLALNSGVAEEAIDAIRDARSTALLTTFDVSDQVLAAIEAGDILFAVDQQAYLQGFLPVAYAYFHAVAPDEETGGWSPGRASSTPRMCGVIRSWT